MTETDYIQHFELQNTAVRGRLLSFGSIVRDILAVHNYSKDAEPLVAEAIALTVLFSSLFKFDGVFSVQAHLNSMIKSIFADVTADGVVRGAATIAEDGGAKTADETQSAGHMVFTVDQGLERENYQGIVEVTENSFLKTFIHYFNQSEQIPTGIRVFIDKDKGQWNARAILLQAIPQYGGEEHQEKHNDKASSKRKEDSSTEDDWRRVMLLLDSCKDEELADGDLSDEDLLMRLFHEDGVVFYDKVIYSKGCRCSRERVESVLYSLNIDDLDDLIVENQITADCEFCGEKFVFDPDDIRATIEAK